MCVIPEQLASGRILEGKDSSNATQLSFFEIQTELANLAILPNLPNSVKI